VPYIKVPNVTRKGGGVLLTNQQKGKGRKGEKGEMSTSSDLGTFSPPGTRIKRKKKKRWSRRLEKGAHPSAIYDPRKRVRLAWFPWREKKGTMTGLKKKKKKKKVQGLLKCLAGEKRRGEPGYRGSGRGKKGKEIRSYPLHTRPARNLNYEKKKKEKRGQKILFAPKKGGKKGLGLIDRACKGRRKGKGVLRSINTALEGKGKGAGNQQRRNFSVSSYPRRGKKRGGGGQVR